IAQVLRRRRPELPICAIAGIDASNAAATIKAGADGVAVISALSLAENPPDAARELRAIVDPALAERTGKRPRSRSPLRAPIPAGRPGPRPSWRRSPRSGS